MRRAMSMATMVLATAALVAIASWTTAQQAAPASAPAKPPTPAPTKPATPAAESADKPVMVLDQWSSWRLFATLKPPVVEDGDKLVPHLEPQRWYNLATAEVASGWQQTDFDDSGWLRGTTPHLGRVPHLGHGCLRGKFTVTDPARVKDLKLTVAYQGGLIVYLNGQEVTRADLPKEAPAGKELVATSYPLECYVAQSGDLLAPEGTRRAGVGNRAGKPDEDSAARMKKRQRTLTDAVIPGRLLKRGVNVLAIEMIRAPYHQVLTETTKTAGKCRDNAFDWNTCQVDAVSLVAASADGLVPNAARPQGLQVWNSDFLNSDTDMDWGDPNEPLRPICISGPRNGWFSGKVVVGSTSPITGLSATSGDLKADGGSAVIPASAVRIRYATAWSVEWGKTRPDESGGQVYRRYAVLMGKLETAPPAELPVVEKEKRNNRYDHPLASDVVAGAVAPVWVTVKIPADVPPGLYRGTLTLRTAAGGDQPLAVVPIEVKALPWKLPDPADYRTWVEIVQSPDTLAIEYQVPLWGEEHWKLIANSFTYMNEIGCRVVYVPLLAQTNWGNAESMVRWVQKSEDQYEYDFSIMDRYLDLAEKVMGKPKLVISNVWDIYMIPKTGNPTRGGHNRMVNWMDSAGIERGSGPLVTFVDPKTGKTSTGELPTHFDPRSKALWAPLMKQLRDRLAQRGLSDSFLIGVVTDAQPSKQEVQLFAEIAPGVPWVSHGHGGFAIDQKLQGLASVGYQSCVWYTKFADGILTHGNTYPEQSLRGWANPHLSTAFERNTVLLEFPMTRWLHMAETNITGGQRGMGRIAGDYWDVVRDKQGKRSDTVTTRFPNSMWMNLNICNPLLAPGPAGAVATTKFEAFREGLEAAEARIVIERALADEKLKGRLGADLVARVEKALDERHVIMWKTLSNHKLAGTMFFQGTAWRWTPGTPAHNWFIGSLWQDRNELLFTLADEVTRKLAAQ